MPVPKGFDYKLWLGPADHPITKTVACTAFASTMTTPVARSPTLVRIGRDMAQWGLGMDRSGPCRA